MANQTKRERYFEFPSTPLGSPLRVRTVDLPMCRGKGWRLHSVFISSGDAEVQVRAVAVAELRDLLSDLLTDPELFVLEEEET